MKLSLSLIIFIAWVLLAITNVWFDVMSATLFWKLSLTLGLLWCLIFFVRLVNRKGE